MCLTSSSALFLIPAMIAASKQLWIHFIICMTIVVVSSHYHYTKHTDLRDYLLASDYLACAALTLSAIYLAFLHKRYVVPAVCFAIIILLFCTGDMFVWSPDQMTSVTSHTTMHIVTVFVVTYVMFQ
jgi:hypothetical protein